MIYRVKWLGYENTNKEFTWVTHDDIAESAPEKLANFHQAYPDKPGPIDTLPARLLTKWNQRRT